MREFAELCGEQQHPRQTNFFRKAKRFWNDVTGAETRA
jgi:molecular chaperone DnaJ